MSFCTSVRCSSWKILSIGWLLWRSDCIIIFLLQYYCVSIKDPTASTITEAEIVTTAFTMLGLNGECPVDYQAIGLRYAWNAAPCEFKKCAVYSKENDLPSPPFIWNAPVHELIN